MLRKKKTIGFQDLNFTAEIIRADISRVWFSGLGHQGGLPLSLSAVLAPGVGCLYCPDIVTCLAFAAGGDKISANYQKQKVG